MLSDFRRMRLDLTMTPHTIHHVTAVTSQINRNLEFYTDILGLRLVKKSVNQDDVEAYHLFYADALGTPGTDMTFFDWPKIGANLPGPATIGLTSFKIPGDSLEWWEARLEVAGAFPELVQDEIGRSSILFTDPEGQRLELMDDTGMSGTSVPWTGSVPLERALKGILGVSIDSARPDMTRRVLTELLGYREVKGLASTLSTGDESSYAEVTVQSSGNRRPGKVGAGGVHHVAFSVDTDDELTELQGKIEAVGIQTSGYIDRFYFHSVYFREPGGVLFELATKGPGFTSDESLDTLGVKLALPPFLEDRRSEIESGLKPLK